ncbi:3'-5' exonuclease [Halomonas sp. MCCC 1A11057]|jgi:DNA polymerase-3 subunit epsilon|uniref:3'-5' exonuclease n=1 Tax=Halomonas sp. MCCC 1A11057 TaxID=2733482 RepID=UPI001F2AAE5F|nr:3'-5' exonuclease [Halomonas sp. MCCC 1A11057]MCE8032891.1 3'-5' exonuclease [Halomonas sp. MCCC 1A11057]
MLSYRFAARSHGHEWPAYFQRRAAEVQDPLLRRFFAADWPAPDTPIGEVPLVALDLETTGLDVQRHAIVSIGLVPFNLDRIMLAQRRYWLVRPSRPLSEASIAFHRITHSEVAEAPDLGDILPELLEALSGRLAVVHFRHIERPFLDEAIKARLGEGVRFPVIDTMSLEARLYRLSLWSRLRRWMRRPPVSIRLGDSRRRYGLPLYQGHHALVDALATAELFQAQVASHYGPELPVSALWT